jgi:hypothetical protein
MKKVYIYSLVTVIFSFVHFSAKADDTINGRNNSTKTNHNNIVITSTNLPSKVHPDTHNPPKSKIPFLPPDEKKPGTDMSCEDFAEYFFKNGGIEPIIDTSNEFNDNSLNWEFPYDESICDCTDELLEYLVDEWKIFCSCGLDYCLNYNPEFVEEWLLKQLFSFKLVEMCGAIGHINYTN